MTSATTLAFDRARADRTVPAGAVPAGAVPAGAVPAGRDGLLEAALPVVLLHAGVADRRMWDGVWPLAGSDRESIRLDLRGFGESSAAPDGPVRHADDVADLLAGSGVGRAHLVGASLGAGVAVELAVTRPGLVASLLLAAPGGQLLPDWTAELRAFATAESAALDAGDLDAAVEANLRWWVDGPRRPAGSADPDVRSAVAAMQRRAFEVRASWPDGVQDAEPDPPVLARLGEVDAPTLVVRGEEDVDVVADAAAALLAGLSRVTEVVWPGVAHLPAVERPGEFAALLTGWLAGIDG